MQAVEEISSPRGATEKKKKFFLRQKLGAANIESRRFVLSKHRASLAILLVGEQAI